MKSLSGNWITEKLVDFEYKKYVLLAYLQEVNSSFNKNKLYPSLAELIKHYKNVLMLRENKQQLYDQFPERMTGIDEENVNLVFDRIIHDDEMMDVIESIIDFSIPKFENALRGGKKVYESVEGNLDIFPVGIMPLKPSEGYFILRNGSTSYTDVYEYLITLFNQPDDRYRGIHTQYVTTYEKTISNSYESIKIDLIKTYKKLPNPATYVIETESEFPMEETFFPVAIRTLIKYISATSELD